MDGGFCPLPADSEAAESMHMLQPDTFYMKTEPEEMEAEPDDLLTNCLQVEIEEGGIKTELSQDDSEVCDGKATPLPATALDPQQFLSVEQETEPEEPSEDIDPRQFLSVEQTIEPDDPSDGVDPMQFLKVEQNGDMADCDIMDPPVAPVVDFPEHFLFSADPEPKEPAPPSPEPEQVRLPRKSKKKRAAEPQVTPDCQFVLDLGDEEEDEDAERRVDTEERRDPTYKAQPESDDDDDDDSDEDDPRDSDWQPARSTGRRSARGATGTSRLAETQPCPLCPVQLAPSQLDAHFNTKHRDRYKGMLGPNKQGNLVCRVCNFSFGKSAVRLYRHWVLMHGNVRVKPANESAAQGKPLKKIMFRCGLCGTQFLSATEVTRHMWIAHRQASKMPPVACPICHSTIQWTDFDWHVQECGQRSKAPIKTLSASKAPQLEPIKTLSATRYLCAKCKVQFDTRSLLDLHFKIVHPNAVQVLKGVQKGDDIGDGTVSGTSSQASASSSATFEVRESSLPSSSSPPPSSSNTPYPRNLAPASAPIKCPHCPFVTVNKQLMAQHLSLAHPSLASVLVCPHCPAVALSKALMARHVAATHTRATRLACRHCSSTFPSQQQLDLHVSHAHRTGQPPSKKHKADRESPEVVVLDDDDEEEVEEMTPKIVSVRSGASLSCPTCSRLFHSESNRDRHAVVCKKLLDLEKKTKAEQLKQQKEADRQPEQQKTAERPLKQPSVVLCPLDEQPAVGDLPAERALQRKSRLEPRVDVNNIEEMTQRLVDRVARRSVRRFNRTVAKRLREVRAVQAETTRMTRGVRSHAQATLKESGGESSEGSSGLEEFEPAAAACTDYRKLLDVEISPRQKQWIRRFCADCGLVRKTEQQGGAYCTCPVFQMRKVTTLREQKEADARRLKQMDRELRRVRREQSAAWDQAQLDAVRRKVEARTAVSSDAQSTEEEGSVWEPHDSDFERGFSDGADEQGEPAKKRTVDQKVQEEEGQDGSKESESDEEIQEILDDVEEEEQTQLNGEGNAALDDEMDDIDLDKELSLLEKQDGRQHENKQAGLEQLDEQELQQQETSSPLQELEDQEGEPQEECGDFQDLDGCEELGTAAISQGDALDSEMLLAAAQSLGETPQLSTDVPGPNEMNSDLPGSDETFLAAAQNLGEAPQLGNDMPGPEVVGELLSDVELSEELLLLHGVEVAAGDELNLDDLDFGLS